MTLPPNPSSGEGDLPSPRALHRARPTRARVPPSTGRWRRAAVAILVLGLVRAAPAPADRPDILLVTVDTLRPDRMSVYGHDRPTSPVLDHLVRRGVRFDAARTPEPLTAPAIVSMLTGHHPHEHGASRNGLRMRPDLVSWPTILARRGYRTAAFVGNWTLKAELCGLDEHFEDYEGVFSRKRWFGITRSEATAEDLTDAALAWVGQHAERERRGPFLLWVHYVEPHAPYRFHQEFAPRLRLDSSNPPPKDRYDTEIAYVDRSIGRLLDGIRSRLGSGPEPLVLFASDHGESLGEHGYWGHGRNLHDPNLRIPMSITWEKRLAPGVITELSSLLDLGPTVLGLLGLPADALPHGHDWSARLRGEADPAADRAASGRVTLHQAHKGAVQRSRNHRARRQGLLEVGLVSGSRKELLRVKGAPERGLFDLAADPGETRDLDPDGSGSAALLEWLEKVRLGLDAADELPAAVLDDESMENLRDLGYLD